MHQRVTDIKIMPAPINAHMPGISPSKTATQTGFNSGSTTPISEQARGEQFPLAFATKIYGIPSWKMPKSTKNSHPVLLGAKGRKNVNGSPTAAVSNCPNSTALMRSSPSAEPSVMYISAREMPAPTATIFPKSAPPDMLSIKNRIMPIKVAPTAIKSAFLIFRCRNSAEIATMKMGDVNCKTMAFAAVVNLLAHVNAVNVPQRNNADSAVFLFKIIFCFSAFMHKNTQSAANRLRNPEMEKGFELICFMKMPAVLHKTDAVTICR